MKKILIILITIPLFFGSCEKEEEENNNNTNNNSSLNLEQTRWNVSSLQYTDTESGTIYTFTLPVTDEEGWDTGLEEIEWTFFNNNGFFLEKIVNGYGYAEYDTLTYTHYENLNTISFSNPNSSNVTLISEMTISQYPNNTGSIQIVDFTSNTLSVGLVDNELSCIVHLNKSN